ncbi:lipoyl protein ligase domain-containing protein [Escherichia coli]
MHNLGNTCFTFMAGKPSHKTISTSIVLNALNAPGVSAEASGHNDLVVKTTKVTAKYGSAYARNQRSLASTTAPCCSMPTSRLANYLDPDKKKLAAKGIT